MLIREMADFFVALPARQALPTVLRINRVLDTAVANAVVAYTDALVFQMFAKEGVPVPIAESVQASTTRTGAKFCMSSSSCIAATGFRARLFSGTSRIGAAVAMTRFPPGRCRTRLRDTAQRRQPWSSRAMQIALSWIGLCRSVISPCGDALSLRRGEPSPRFLSEWSSL
jgi:hypothetical protein